MSKNIKRKGWIEFLDGQKIDIFEVYRFYNGAGIKLYTPVGTFYYRNTYSSQQYGVHSLMLEQHVLYHIDFNGAFDFGGEPQTIVQSVKFREFVLFDKQVKELY